MPLEVNDFINQCLVRGVPPAQFHQLLKELSRTSQFDLRDLTALYTDVSPDHEFGLLKLEYILELLLEDSFSEVLFGSVLGSLAPDSQACILACLVQQHTNTGQINLQGLNRYLDTVLAAPRDTQLDGVIGRLLRIVGNDEALARFSGTAVAKHDAKKPSSLLSNRLNAKLLRLKKVLWLFHQVTVAYVPLVTVEQEAQFIAEFKQVLKISQAPTASTNTTIAFELIAALFECYQLEASPVWEEFVLFKLPLLLKRSLKMPQDTLEEVVHNSLENVPGLHTTLKIDLVKSLVRLELIKQASGARFGLIGDEPVDTGLDELLAGTVSHSTTLGAAFKELFLDANPEFVSFEESGALALIEQIASGSLCQRRSFSLLVQQAVGGFIRDRDSARLHRLLLMLGTNLRVLSDVVLAVGPYQFVQPLIGFLASWDAAAPKREPDQDQDLFGADDDDDVNFQDYYTDYSCVLLVVFYVFHRFQLELAMLVGTAASDEPTFLLDFVRRSMGLPQPALKKELQDSSSKLNRLVNDWINSLFDSDVLNASDGGGISDDLIRSSSVRDCFKVIPVVFQEAVLAHGLGLLGDEALLNGLEYFLQPFLMCTIVGIFDFATDRLWELQGSGSPEIRLLLRLVQSLVAPGAQLKGEAYYMHRLVLEVSAGGLCSALRPYIGESDAIRQLVETYDTAAPAPALDRSFAASVKQICDAEVDAWSLKGLFPLVDLAGVSRATEELLQRAVALGADSPAGGVFLEIGAMVLSSYLLARAGALADEGRVWGQLAEFSAAPCEELEALLVGVSSEAVVVEEDDADTDEDDEKADAFGKKAFDSGFMGMLKTDNEMEQEQEEQQQQQETRPARPTSRADATLLELLSVKHEAWKAGDSRVLEAYDVLTAKMLANSGSFR